MDNLVKSLVIINNTCQITVKALAGLHRKIHFSVLVLVSRLYYIRGFFRLGLKGKLNLNLGWKGKFKKMFYKYQRTIDGEILIIINCLLKDL